LTDAPDDDAIGADDLPADSPEELTGPPGSTVFSLDRRPAAGLYLLAWLLTVGGIAVTFIGIQTAPGLPRLLVLVGLVVLALGLATSAGYQILARAARPPEAYRGPSPVLLFFLVVVLVNLFGGVISVVTGGSGLEVERPDVFLVGLLIQVAAYVAAIVVFVIAPRALSWRDLTGTVRRSASALIGDAANAAGVMLPVTIVALIVGSIAALLAGATPPQVVPLPQTLGDTLLDAVGAVVLAPLGEELFFRGFALTAWRRDLGDRAALIRSSLFFALVHILNVQAAPGELDVALRSALVLLVVLLPVGFVLGWLFLRRGLAASVTGHMTYNGIVFGLLLLSSMLPAPTG